MEHSNWGRKAFSSDRLLQGPDYKICCSCVYFVEVYYGNGVGFPDLFSTLAYSGFY